MIDTPLVLNLAPTGAVADFRRNPNVPVTPAAIIADVTACTAAGAAIAHLHVRDEGGAPSCDAGLFGTVIAGIRRAMREAAPILCASTSGRHAQTLDQRCAVLDLSPDLRPEMASLTLGSLNFVTGPSINAPETIRALLDRMNARGVMPELEIFDIGMIDFMKVLIAEGRLRGPFYVNLLLGNPGGLQATPAQLGFALSLMPPEALVAIAGIGRAQGQATAMGAVCADGVRIGLEDNLWSDPRLKTPATNLGLVQRIVGLCDALGRPLASPAQTRARLAFPRS